MENFDDYIIQGEPNSAEKAKVWKTAIGLQQVDGLTPSAYLIETAKQNIEGNITIAEVNERIQVYYMQHPIKDTENRTEEADKVSSRIVAILSEVSFTFSPAEFISIHSRLFKGLYKFAGKIRDYNITKKEWVLNGETVLYGNAESLKATLEYDFEQEKKYNYKGLSQIEVIDHIMHFTSYLWQIHIFGEGNTRSVAIFLIKYLRTFGFKVNIDLFALHSWYFRNALIRANFNNHANNNYATYEFLLLFFENLLLGQNHILKNRTTHIHFEGTRNEQIKTSNDPLNDLVNDPVKMKIITPLKQNSRANYKEMAANLSYTTATIKRHIQALKKMGLLVRVGSDKTGHWEIN